MMQAKLVTKLTGLCDLMAMANQVDASHLSSIPPDSARTPLGDRTNVVEPPVCVVEKKQPVLTRQSEVRNFSPWDSEQPRRLVENPSKVDLGVAAHRLKDQRMRSWDSASYSSQGGLSNCSSRSTFEVPSQMRWRRPAPGERCPGAAPWRCGSMKALDSSTVQQAESGTSVSTTYIWEPWDGSSIVSEDSGLELSAALRRDRLREGAHRPSSRTAHGIFAASLRDSIFVDEDRSRSRDRSPSWDSTAETRRTTSQSQQRNARERSRQSSLDPKRADAVLQAVCCDAKQAEDAKIHRRNTSLVEFSGYDLQRRKDRPWCSSSGQNSTASISGIPTRQSSAASISGIQCSQSSVAVCRSSSARRVISGNVTQDGSRTRPHSANARAVACIYNPLPGCAMGAAAGSRGRNMSSNGMHRVRSGSGRSASPRGTSPWSSTSSLDPPRTTLPRSKRPSSRQGTPLGALRSHASAQQVGPWAQSECRREIMRLREELHRATERLCGSGSLGCSSLTALTGPDSPR